MNPFSDDAPCNSAFKFQIPGSALKAAILARIEREEAAFEAEPEVPVSAPLSEVERAKSVEALIAYKLVAEHLVDDKLYDLTLDDVFDLITVQQPAVNNAMVMVMNVLQMLRAQAQGSNEG